MNNNKNSGQSDETTLLKELEKIIHKPLLVGHLPEMIKRFIPKRVHFNDSGYVIELDLMDCQLGTLPNSFGVLKSLKKLNLNGNMLKALPESFGELNSLEVLCLGWNKLTTLPKSFGKLITLKVLDLDYNKIMTLPDSLLTLPNLGVLDLKGNFGISKQDAIIQKLMEKGVRVLLSEENT